LKDKEKEAEGEEDVYERFEDSDFVIVDDEIIKSGEYTMKDVYIPILGSEFVFDDQCISHRIYKGLLEEENITVDDIKKLSHSFMVCGSWRSMIRIAEDLSWK